MPMTPLELMVPPAHELTKLTLVLKSPPVSLAGRNLVGIEAPSVAMFLLPWLGPLTLSNVAVTVLPTRVKLPVRGTPAPKHEFPVSWASEKPTDS